MEAEIGDIADMSNVCDLLADHFADQLIALREMNMTGKQVAEQAERSYAPVLFAVRHLSAMATG